MVIAEQFKVQTACVLGGVISVGIARFAYTPMLPEMVDDIGLTESVAGFLAAANYAGYLCGALIISFLHCLTFKVTLYKCSLFGAALTTLGMATTEHEELWYLLRFLSGLSTAGGVLLGGGLLMHWLRENKAKPELGIFFSSLGIGIVLTAVTAEMIKAAFPWDQQWLIYGVLASVLIIPVLFWFPRFGHAAKSTGAANILAKPSRTFFVILQSAYFCAGFGYVVTATFLVAMVEMLPGLEGQGWAVWLWVGIAAAPGCWLWDLYARKVGLWSALLQAYLVNGASVALLLWDQSQGGVYGSAVLYGFSFIGIVSMTLAMMGRLYPDNPSKPMSHLTFSYGIAQVIAPALVGVLAQQNGSFSEGLSITLAVLGVGTVLLVCASILLKRSSARLSTNS
jgi:predicted MFS family arabinose efflux permease